jgi:hypothetical protein
MMKDGRKVRKGNKHDQTQRGWAVGEGKQEKREIRGKEKQEEGCRKEV